jgi:hypothetical protein
LQSIKIKIERKNVLTTRLSILDLPKTIRVLIGKAISTTRKTRRFPCEIDTWKILKIILLTARMTEPQIKLEIPIKVIDNFG